jgi:hypothetical protein
MDQNPVDLKAVLADLRARRDQLDKAIDALEAYVGSAGITVSAISQSNGRHPVPEQITIDTFTGKNIAEASAMYLGMVGRPARSTAEITEALVRGGLKVSEVSVGTILARIHRAKGSIHRPARRMWGLSEWYGGNVRAGTSAKRSASPAKKQFADEQPETGKAKTKEKKPSEEAG